MKTLLLPLCYTLVSLNVAAQIKFSSTYDATGMIPFGEVVAIIGKTTGLQSLSLTIHYRTQQKSIPISVQPDGSWSGLLPALPAKTRVVFAFHELRKATQADKQQALELLQITASQFLDSLRVTPFNGLTDQEAKVIIDGLYDKVLPAEKLTQFSTSQGKSLGGAVREQFRALTANSADMQLLIDLNNLKVKVIDEKRTIPERWVVVQNASLLAQPLKVDDLSVSMNTPIDSIADFLARKPVLLDSLRKRTSDATLLATINNLKRNVERYNQAKNDFSAKDNEVFGVFHAKLEALIAFVDSGTFFVRSLETESLQTTELLKFASIDVGGMYFPNWGKPTAPSSSTQASATAFGGFFFMISPYIQDIFAYKKYKSNPHPGYGLAPTVGVALFQVLGDNPKPVYFLGGSFRLNEAFRVNVGCSVFKLNKTEQKTYGIFGFGVALRVANLGDLMRLLSATTSELTTLPDIP